MPVHSCPSCTCQVEEAPHACEWCNINYNHPRCPENADEPKCPHCGSDPEDVTMHAEGCPTLGTCASGRSGIPRPWHPEVDWLDGKPWTLEAANRHYAEAH